MAYTPRTMSQTPSFDLGDIAVPRRRRPRRSADAPSPEELSAIADDVSESILSPRPEESSPPPISPSDPEAEGLDLRLDAPTMRPTSILRRMARDEAERRIAGRPLDTAVVDDGPDAEPDLDADDNLFGARPSFERPVSPSTPDRSPSLRSFTREAPTVVDDVDLPRTEAGVIRDDEDESAPAMKRPDVVDLYDTEKEALDRAERQDRRRRIAHGVTGGLGLLGALAGALTGSEGLATLGSTVAGASGAIQDNRRERVMGDITARRGREQAQQTAYDTRAQQAAEQERQARRDALAERGAEADISLTQARIGSEQADAADAAFEREALAGNAAGMRSAIRSRIAAVQHGPTRAAWEAQVGREGGELDQMTDLDSLRNILDNVARTDIRRGGQGAGGSGGGSRSSDVFNPVTGQYETRTVRTGPRAAASVPSDGGLGRVGGAPSAPSAPLAPEAGPVDESTEVAWAERVMNAAGWLDRDRREGIIRKLRTGRGNAAHDSALAEMTDLAGRTERTRERGVSGSLVDVPEADLQRMEAFARTQMTPIVANRRRALGLMSAIRGWRRTRPLALRAAIETQRDPESASNFAPDVLAQAQDITRQFASYVNPMLSERSGAAVTNSEMNRALRELGLASAAGDLGALERAFDAQVTEWENQIADRAADLHPEFVRQWAQAHGFGGE